MLDRYSTFLFRLAVLFVALPLVAQQAAQPAATVWNGVYTKGQATRGESVFDSSCSSCHQPDLSGYGRLLLDQMFMDHWREDNLGSFFHRVKFTMPMRAPASLSDTAYIDIVAFILQANGFPAGKTELTAAALERIQIEAKDGPQAVPDFSLVRSVGCLVKAADGEWLLEHSTPARRTRNPKESTADELKGAAAQSGSGTFHFLRIMPYDAEAFHLEAQKDHKVEAKGFLIRKPGQETLNLTSITTAAPACAVP